MELVIYDLLIDSNLKNKSAHAADRGANKELENNLNFKEQSLQTLLQLK